MKFYHFNLKKINLIYLIRKAIYSKLLSNLLGKFLLIFGMSLLVTCSSGSNRQDYDPNRQPILGQLELYIPKDFTIGVSETNEIKVNLINSANIKTPVTVNVSVDKPDLANITPNNCLLNTQNNTCSINIKALGYGTIVIKAQAQNYAPTTTRLTINDSFVYADAAGIIRLNNKILEGNSSIAWVNGYAINTLAMDPAGIPYVGTDYGYILKYNSQLNLWQRLGPGTVNPDNASIYSLAIDNNANIYAGDANGYVYEYQSNIDSWQQITSNPLDDSSAIIALAANTNNMLFAATASGNVFQYQGDNSWVQLGSSIEENTGITALSIDNNNKIYVGNEAGNIFTWDPINHEWLKIGDHIDNSAIITFLAFENNNIYASTSMGKVFRWDQTNQSWLQLGATIDNSASINSLSIDSMGNVYAATSNAKIFKYLKGDGTWNQFGARLINQQDGLNLIKITKKGNMYAVYTTVYGTSDSVGLAFKSSINTPIWHPAGSETLDGSDISALDSDNKGNIYAATSNNNIFQYNSKEAKWLQLPNPSQDTSSIIPLLVDAQGNIYIGTAIGNVLEYSQSNHSWQTLGSSTVDGNNSVKALILYQNNLYAGTNSGRVFLWDKNNNSWNLVSDDALINEEGLSNLIVNKDGVFYGRTGNLKIYKLIAGHWQIVYDKTPTNFHFISIVIDANGILYAGNMDGEIYNFTNNQWTKIGDTLLYSASIYNLALDNASNIYATSDNSNVYVHNLNNLTTPWQIKYKTETAVFELAKLKSIVNQ